METMISKPAPDEHQQGSDNNGTDQGHAIEPRLARDVQAQQAYDYKDGKKTYNDGTDDAIWHAPAGNQFSNNANNSRDNKPDKQCSKRDNHGCLPPISKDPLLLTRRTLLLHIQKTRLLPIASKLLMQF
jgi:hypothetical protein